MMQIRRTKSFDRQLKSLLKNIIIKGSTKKIKTLVTDDQEYLHKLKDHALTGNLKSLRELHIQKDWLLIYERNDEILTLVLVSTGSHSQPFGK